MVIETGFYMLVHPYRTENQVEFQSKRTTKLPRERAEWKKFKTGFGLKKPT